MDKLNEIEDEYKNISQLFSRVKKCRDLLHNYFASFNRLNKLKSDFEKEVEKQNLNFQEYKKHELAYAKAAALDDKTRQQAEKIKKDIHSQLEKYPFCPYCQKGMNNVPHADHIYPVATGGLSTMDNMVYTCAECNLKKSDLTLREFIDRFNLDRNKIEDTLRRLGKRF